MNIKRTLANWLFKAEFDNLRAVTGEVIADWHMLPYTLNRQSDLVEMLGEMDPHLYDMMTRMSRDYSVVSSTSANESYRLSLVQQSRSMHLTDPVYSFGVKTWTDFGFSSSPKLTADDPAAQKMWDEFFSADRNAPTLGDRKLHKLSDNLIIDGEVFFVIFASTVDGECTLRTVDTTQIKEIIYDPEDRNIPLYYRREFSTRDGGLDQLYYPDWAATAGQLERVELPNDAHLASALQIGDLPGTDVKVLHVAFREVNGRGWPLASTGMDWENAYSGFLKDRAAVAKASASVVEKIRVKGGQRAIDAIGSRINSTIGSADGFERNPPPVGGSVWMENEAMNREWMNRPTGAGDAEKDGIPLITQVGLAFGLFPHYLGRGDYYRLATATAMEMPVLKSFNRYQNFWSSIWRDLFKIMLNMAETHGSASFGERNAHVSSDRIIDLDQAAITSATTALTTLVDRALIDTASASELGKLLLQASLETMGIQGSSEALQAAQTGEVGESHTPFRGGGRHG